MRDLWFPLPSRGPSTLCSGDDVTNVYGWHTSGGAGGLPRSLAGWKPRVHHGQLEIDVEADHEATGAALSDLVAAAHVGAIAFAQAIAAEWGQAFADAVAPVVPDMRADLLRLA